MILDFKVKQVTQSSAYLLSKYKGEGISKQKFLLLLYLINRKSVEIYGHPLIPDNYRCFSFGPVPLTVYNIVKGKIINSFFSEYIEINSICSNFTVYIKDNPGIGQLSKREIELINEFYLEWKNKDITIEWIKENLPEYKNGQDIIMEDILKVVGYPNEQIKDIIDDLLLYRMEDEVLGKDRF